MDGHSEGINSGASRHAQVSGIHPGQADAGTGIELVAKEPLQKVTLEPPWQGRDRDLEQHPRNACCSHG